MNNEYPSPVAGVPKFRGGDEPGVAPGWDIRSALAPSRLAIAMWDFAYLGRHCPGESMEDYPMVLGGLKSRGYNCVRIDPFAHLPGWLDNPDKVHIFPDENRPFLPWGWNRPFEAPVGRWIGDFIETVRDKEILYILSSWWLLAGWPESCIKVTTLAQAAELMADLLGKWKKRFGFEGLVYVDLCNELPYFIHGFLDQGQREAGLDWGAATFNAEQTGWLAGQINPALGALRREFPELLFTISIHGDPRWIDVPVEFDCLDVHFYADVDQRWNARTRFSGFMERFFTDQDWHAEFSDRWRRSKPAWPMFRARQRDVIAQFSRWAIRRGMPLTTSEGWSAWYADNAPDYDLQPLIAWSEWALEDAIEFGFWGWTPHSYVQPQYGPLWTDEAWHRKMTGTFFSKSAAQRLH